MSACARRLGLLVSGLVLWPVLAGPPESTGVPADFPRFRHQGIALDSRGLKYNPCDDVIIPSVIRVDSKIARPPGRYLMYYAPHDAPGGICLAHADAPSGPWKEYEANPVIGRNWPPHHQVSHVSGPHILWIPEESRYFLYYHGENDVTRIASTEDGIHFRYEGVAFTARAVPGLSEASYARIFRHELPGSADRYLALFMGNQRGTRKIFRATSRDGRAWTTRPEPLVEPPPGTGQVAQAWLFPWKGQNYLLYHAHDLRNPSLADLHVSAVDDAMTRTRPLGIVLPRTAAGPDNVAEMSPCLLEDAGRLYLYTNIGPRLHQKIAWAVADIPAPLRPPTPPGG